MSSLVQYGHQAKFLWRQQVVFQELIEQLAAALDTPVSSPSSACAEAGRGLSAEALSGRVQGAGAGRPHQLPPCLYCTLHAEGIRLLAS